MSGKILFLSGPRINYLLSVQHHSCCVVVVYFLICNPEWKPLVMSHRAPARSVKVIITYVYLKRYRRVVGVFYTEIGAGSPPWYELMARPAVCQIWNIINIIAAVIRDRQCFLSVILNCVTTVGNYFVLIVKLLGFRDGPGTINCLQDIQLVSAGQADIIFRKHSKFWNNFRIFSQWKCVWKIWAKFHLGKI